MESLRKISLIGRCKNRVWTTINSIHITRVGISLLLQKWTHLRILQRYHIAY
nr:MAG TPA: hypothetical protein [Bacteriophage sp.]